MTFSGTVGKTLEKNIVECNRVLQKIIYFSFAIPIVFLILIRKSLIFMPFEGYLLFCIVIIFINAMEFILNKESVSKSAAFQRITMYFGLMSVSIINGLTGSFSAVPFYFAYILCMPCNVQLIHVH